LSRLLYLDNHFACGAVTYRRANIADAYGYRASHERSADGFYLLADPDAKSFQAPGQPETCLYLHYPGWFACGKLR
jgi:hypothetical protein